MTDNELISSGRVESWDKYLLFVRHDVNGIPFFIGKVLKRVTQNTSNGEAQVLWYQPKMPTGLKDNIEKFFKRYQNCIQQVWEPSRECNDFVPIKSIFGAWKNTVGIRNVTSALGIRT